MERNDSNDQITIDQETLDMHINDLNLASLLEKICSKKRFEQLEKIQNYSNIIENLNKSGGAELVNKFLNLDPNILAGLGNKHLDLIIIDLYRSGGKELLEKFLNLDQDRLKVLSEFNYIVPIICNLHKYGKKEFVEKFLDLDPNILAGLGNKYLDVIITDLYISGGKELLEKFLNLDQDKLKVLSEINDLYSIISYFSCLGRSEFVKQLINLDLEVLQNEMENINNSKYPADYIIENLLNPSKQQTNVNVDNIQIAQVTNTEECLLNQLPFKPRYS